MLTEVSIALSSRMNGCGR